MYLSVLERKCHFQNKWKNKEEEEKIIQVKQSNLSLWNVNL